MPRIENPSVIPQIEREERRKGFACVGNSQSTQVMLQFPYPDFHIFSTDKDLKFNALVILLNLICTTSF